MDARIAIIGSGFGGLGAAIRLKRDGEDNFIVFERADDVGGTWRDNTYPGCACDVESHLYSYSFALEPDWSYRFSRQPEIWRYLQRCADSFGIRPHIRFGHEVLSAAWDDVDKCWRLDTSRGPFTARVLVMATGPLSETVVPDLPGLGSFQGRAFHSARWDHTRDLTSRRVAVIGTGASAIQFIPEIQPRVSQLYVFQRTPAWVIPRPDAPISTTRRDLYRRHPVLQRLARLLVYATREWRFLLFRHPGVMRLFEKLAIRYLAISISDPVLRDKLTPTYRMGCKRILLSSDYYPAMAQSNVELVTAAISEVRPHSIVDTDGVERPVDAIIFGTGFRPTDPPLAAHIRGRDGQTLREVWRGSPHAHLGTTLAGFPNLFFLLGPNTGLGHNSVVYMTEAQIDHLLHALHYMARHHLDALEPRAEAQQAFVADVDRRMQGTVWVSGGCRSWYLDGTGRNSALWPGSSFSFYRRVANFRPSEYVHA